MKISMTIAIYSSTCLPFNDTEFSALFSFRQLETWKLQCAARRRAGGIERGGFFVGELLAKLRGLGRLFSTADQRYVQGGSCNQAEIPGNVHSSQMTTGYNSGESNRSQRPLVTAGWPPNGRRPRPRGIILGQRTVAADTLSNRRGIGDVLLFPLRWPTLFVEWSKF